MGEEDVGKLQEEVLGDGGDMEVEVGDQIREATTVSEATKVQVRASPRLQRSKDLSWLRLRRGLLGTT
jgi:hypothetical protein